MYRSETSSRMSSASPAFGSAERAGSVVAEDEAPEESVGDEAYLTTRFENRWNPPVITFPLVAFAGFASDIY